MIIKSFDSNDEWMAARRGKITGSRLGDIIVKRGTGEKIAFYETIAERLGLPPDEEGVMQRGHRLEGEALEYFTKETGKEVDGSLVMWSREDNEAIAVSPDGQVVGLPEAVEVKCLSSARHIEAVLTGEIPKEYQYQVRQYFIVNDELQALHVVFYDPRLLAKPFFMKTITRQEVQEDVDNLLAEQQVKLREIERIVLMLSPL